MNEEKCQSFLVFILNFLECMLWITVSMQGCIVFIFWIFFRPHSFCVRRHHYDLQKDLSLKWYLYGSFKFEEKRTYIAICVEANLCDLDNEF